MKKLLKISTAFSSILSKPHLYHFFLKSEQLCCFSSFSILADIQITKMKTNILQSAHHAISLIDADLTTAAIAFVTLVFKY